MMSGRSVDVSVDDVGPGLSDFGGWGRANHYIFMYEALRQYIFIILVKFGCFLIFSLQFSQVLLDIGNR